MNVTCPHCGNDDESMLEEIGFSARTVPGLIEPVLHTADELRMLRQTYLCVSCSKEFSVEVQP